MNNKKNNQKSDTPPMGHDTLLCAGQMKCDTCQFKKHYSTGGDEYPAYTTVEYCSKGHWENYTPDSADKVDIFYNCADFLPCT
ncbi:MAG: hypothetical protein WC319_15095 [Candidatus Paceibacterota bacterium]|jgi:hypothetical protein